ncbi:hypothetical protein DL96DRAFT_1606317 [Flagelloscypha sp. PMI_526]|nr:hypothetical protein DL96DRAFT_1606317 [Flagelloscypha sp. PMI_526]
MASVCRLLLHCLVFRLVWGATKKVTIDDSIGSGTPTYTPSTGQWEDQNCADCWLTPDKAKAFQGSWTAATYNPGKGPMYFDLTFEGTGIEIYFILANNAPRNPTTDTKASFILDGKTDGAPYLHPHDSSSDYYYNQKVYSKSGLSQSKHTLRVGIPDGNEQGSYWIAFDYAIVTVEVPDPTTAVAPTTPSTTSAKGTTSASTSSTSTKSGSLSLSSSVVTTSTGGASSAATPGSSDSNPGSGNNQNQSDNATSNSVPQVSGASNKAAVIGGTVAGVVIAMAFALLAFLFIRRRRRTHKSSDDYDTLMLAGRPADAHFSAHTSNQMPQHSPNTMSFYAASAPASTSSHGLTPSRYTITSERTDLYNPYANDSFTAAPAPVSAPRSIHETHAEELARRDARQRELEDQLAQMQQQLSALHASQTQAQASGQGAQESNFAAEKAALRARVDDTRSQIDNLHLTQPPEYTPLPY